MSARYILQAGSSLRRAGPQLTKSRAIFAGRILNRTPSEFQSIGLNTARRTCASTSFSIQEILPAQDAFAQRHLGPRKSERDDMLRFLNLEVNLRLGNHFLWVIVRLITSSNTLFLQSNPISQERTPVLRSPICNEIWGQ